MTETCDVPDCRKAPIRRMSVCSMHEVRMRRTGTYEAPARAHASPIERVMRRVDKTDTCWLWEGTVNNKGYGTISVTVNGKQRTAFVHRVSYEASVGPIPFGTELLHSCDTPRCVNPRHLRPGTHAENMAEMRARGRGRSGVRRRAAA